MMSNPVKIRVKLRGPAKSGQGGKTRGGSVKSVLVYLQDKAATDYYGDKGQAPQEAMGQLWTELGLAPGLAPTDEQLAELMNGRGLNGEETAKIRTTKKDGEEIVAAFDMPFTVPKSVSGIWALADDTHRHELNEDILAAVRETVGWIEDEGYVTVRSGHNGSVVEPAQKLAIMAYSHDTSRQEDPNKHVHPLLLNIGQNSKGEWRRLETKGLYHHKIEIGAVFRTALSARLAERGYSIERDGKSFAVTGFPPELHERWSKGRAAIKAKLSEWNAETSEAAQLAAMAVRGTKKHSTSEDLNQRWTAEAAALGVTRDSLMALRQPPAEVQRVEYDEQTVIEEASRNKATFSELDLRRAVAIAFNAGGAEMKDGQALGQLRDAIEAIKRNEQLIELVNHDKTVRWTTAENRRTEITLMEAIVARQGEAWQVKETTVERAIAQAESEFRAKWKNPNFIFGDQERRAVEHLTRGKNCDKYLEGVAGAGKSTLARVIKIAYAMEGREVYGVAIAAKAATGLGDGTGITISTIDSFLHKIETGRLNPRRGDLLMIDESGMVDTKKMERVISIASRHGMETAWVGDRLQLQPIGAGSAFAHVFDCAAPGETAALTKSKRQRGDDAEEWRNFLDGIRHGKNEGLLNFLNNKENLVVAEDHEEIAYSVSAWLKNREAGLADKDNIFVTNRRSTRHQLNEAVRAFNGQADRPDGVEIAVTDRAGNSAGTRHFAPGDRVLTLANARLGNAVIRGAEDQAKVENGSLWTVEQVRPVTKGDRVDALLTLRSDGGRRVQFMTSEYSAMDHGYALTTHQAQGVTTTGLVALPTDMAMMDLHSWYVMLSRAREASFTHVVTPQNVLDEAEEVHGLADPSKAAPTAVDRLKGFLKAVERQRIDTLSLNFQTRKEFEAAGGVISTVPALPVWMCKRGGFNALPKSLKLSAERMYQLWAREKPHLAAQHGIEEYVQFVQERWIEDREKAETQVAYEMQKTQAGVSVKQMVKPPEERRKSRRL